METDSNKKAKVTQLLLSAGADMEIRDNHSHVPLYYAAFHGYISIVKLLLEKGARCDKKGSNGMTPADAAKKNNHHEVHKLIMSYTKNR
jgi:ankyrin repeat protein